MRAIMWLRINVVVLLTVWEKLSMRRTLYCSCKRGLMDLAARDLLRDAIVILSRCEAEVFHEADDYYHNFLLPEHELLF